MKGRRLKVLMDTNVLIDVLTENRPSSHDARIIFDLVKKGQIEGQITMQSVIDASYILRRESGEVKELFKKKILELLTFFNDGGLSYFNIKEACLRPSGGDFEDDALYAHAVEAGCDIIVTGDTAFRKRYEGEGPIRFFTPAEMIAKMVVD